MVGALFSRTTTHFLLKENSLFSSLHAYKIALCKVSTIQGHKIAAVCIAEFSLQNL